MALTYSDSAALMLDQDFRGRIKVAVLNYANYIYGEAPSATAHNTRYQWAQRAYASPDQIATNIQPLVVMDDNVQAQGGSIPDDQLSTAVQNALNKMM